MYRFKIPMRLSSVGDSVFVETLPLSSSICINREWRHCLSSAPFFQADEKAVEDFKAIKPQEHTRDNNSEWEIIHTFFFFFGTMDGMEIWLKLKGKKQRMNPKKRQSAGEKPIHITESKTVPELKGRDQQGDKNRRKCTGKFGLFSNHINK